MSTRTERLGGTEGNEILTSATAVVLTLLLIAEGVTIVLIGDLLSAHMFIGMALIPPVLLKLGSTGYRFARYYSGARVYREKGPPPLLLRLLAPLLVITTIIIFATGVAPAPLRPPLGPRVQPAQGELHRLERVLRGALPRACAGDAARAADRLETLEPAPDPRLGAAARARDRLDRWRSGAGASRCSRSSPAGTASASPD